MSHNQSRVERSEPTQYRRTGRSGSSNQQRQFSGGVPTKGGGGASSGPTNPSNRSFKKYSSNAPVGQPNAGNWNADSSHSSASRASHNGAYQQQPIHRVSDSPIISASSNIKPRDVPSQKITQAVPKSPVSNVSSEAAPSNVFSAGSEPKAPTTPVKAPGDAPKSFSLQFGSISPGFMNGMQIPARTSSAPPNLDEQKKDQAHYESLRTAPAFPTPTAPKQHLPKKGVGILDQPNASEAHLPSKSKRDGQVSAAQHGTQALKPSVHSIPGIPMQVPFHQPQIPVQFGGPNPQIQSQAMSGTSLPMPIPMSVPLGNPPVQHSMFVPGLQPHPMQSQGMMHQGPNLNFSPPMGPQLGNMGMSITTQFSQQPAVKYNSSRKTVKITHPDTHEELRLDSSPAPRPHPGVQSQSQPISSFPPNIPMNFYPSSYNTTSVFYPPASSLSLNSTQVPPTSQPPRVYNQVTVKPPLVSHAEKELLPPSGSLSTGKENASGLKEENTVFPDKEIEALSSSSSPEAKPALGVSSTLPASSGPTVEGDAPDDFATRSAPMDGSASTSTNSVYKTPDSMNDKQKKEDNRDLQDQGDRPSSSLASLPSRLPGNGTVDAKYASSETNLVVKMPKESLLTTVAVSREASGLSSEGATAEKNGKIDESPDLEVTSTSGDLPEHTRDSPEESSGYCSNNVNVDSDLPVSTHILDGQNPESSVSVSTSVQNLKTSTPDALLIVADNIDIIGTTGVQDAPLNQEFLVPSSSEVTFRPEKEEIETFSGGLVSPSLSSVQDKASDANLVKSVVPRAKKKMKELYRKAEAAGTISDLYMAYKGPEEKKEDLTSAESSENPSSISEKQTSADVSLENAVISETDSLGKVEPEDWEDAAEISAPDLGSSRNENQDDDGIESMTKRYTRDFLLKFAKQCTDLPEGFDTSDIENTLMVSSVNVSRESHPSPGRNVDRPGSRSGRRSGFGDDDKRSRVPGPLMSGRGDMWTDVGSMGNMIGLRPVQGGGVLRNPRAQSPSQFGGGILPGSMQSLGPQGVLQRINSDSDRWQRFQKGLMPSPQTPMQVMHRAERRYEVGKVNDEEQAKQRQLKAILNKLTPQNFEKLFQQVKEVNIDNVITLSGVISQIFDKALMEPTFCEMYASFCFHLAADLPELSEDNQKITFKRLLLNKCQEEFEKGEREEEEANKAEEEGEAKQSAEEREEKRLRARRRMLGNIRLIGELYKKRMLTERIMHECINKLLGQYQNPDEENIEALCKLMSTIGEMIDHPKAKEHMDAYYDIMGQLSNNMKLSSRVRFMLKDSIDLRKNKWQQRRKVEGPKKIEEVHTDAAQERQVHSRLSHVPSMGSSGRRGPPVDFGSRSPSMLPSPNSQISGFCGATPQLRGYGSQDIRLDERHSSENRNMPIPLPQRPLGDQSITLGPHHGLARGMAFRGQSSAPNVPYTEIPNPGDGRRMGPGENGPGFMSERAAYSQSEDTIPRYMPDRFAAPQIYDQSQPQEPNIAYRSREFTNIDRASYRSRPNSPPRGGLSSSTHDVSSDKVTEEDLRDKSVAAIKEFYSAKDEKEVALCIKDLNAPGFYPSMISIWVTDSFERKDGERDLLTKLLVNFSKPQDQIITEDNLIKGFESVLAVLEDAVNDAPRAAEFLGRIFAKIILEDIISLSDVGQLIYEGGEEQGQLVEVGLAAEVLGSVLEVIKSEKGESVLNDMRSSSNIRLEDFRPAGSSKSFRIDRFI